MQNKNRELEEEIYTLKLSGENTDFEVAELEKEIKLQSSIRDSLKKSQKSSLSLKNNNLFYEPKYPEKTIQSDELPLDAKVKKLSNFITNQKSSSIVQSALHDFKILKQKFQKSTIQKKVKSSLIQTILVKFDPLDVSDSTPHSVRVTSEFYTILDLLEEVCSFHGLNYKIFDLYDENDTKILLTEIVKVYLNRKKTDHVQIISVYLKGQYKQFNSESIIDNQIDLTVNNLEARLDDNIKILSDDLVDVEDTTIKVFVNRILYFVLLACVFTECLNRLKIHQRYFINQTVENKIFRKRFFSNNAEGLKNSFEIIMDNYILYEWLDKIYLNIFQFRGIN